MKKRFLLLFSIFVAQVNGQIINTVVGCIYSGFNGSSGVATAIALDQPFDVAIDDTGNLYIADFQNNRVCKVNTSGYLTTFAGTGSYVDSGDGGQATAAGVRTPSGLTFDRFGNLYISDGTSRIRKVTPAGIITTVAGNGIAAYGGDGGPATSAELGTPYGIAFDASDNLYIADNDNHRIRKVDTLGVISTFAGTGGPTYSGDGGQATAAGLNHPAAVAFDKQDNLYIADRYNNCVRKVNPSGIITTFAGNGTAGYSGDNGPATSATLHFPSGVAVDSVGNVYIAHYWNNIIRKVDLLGIITTFAGGGNCGSTYCGDGGLATNAELDSPYGIKVSKFNNLYIADFINSRIREVTGLSSGIEKFVKNREEIKIHPNPTSDQFFIEAATNNILKVDLFDINGKHIFRADVNNRSLVNISTLEDGIYTMNIRTGDHIIKKKLIVLH